LAAGLRVTLAVRAAARGLIGEQLETGHEQPLARPNVDLNPGRLIVMVLSHCSNSWPNPAASSATWVHATILPWSSTIPTS
jgi:hypothetical protein